MRPTTTLSLRHVALFVTKFEACVNFYTQLLGMRIEWQPDANNIYLTSGIDNFALHRARGNYQLDKQQRLDHIGFVVAKPTAVDEWYVYLRNRNVRIKMKPRQHRDGARSFYCLDPDDTIVQIIHHPPIALLAHP